MVHTWLEVSIHDAKIMEMLQGTHELAHVKPCRLLEKHALAIQISEQLTPTQVSRELRTQAAVQSALATQSEADKRNSPPSQRPIQE